MGIPPLKKAMKLLYLKELQEQSKGLCKKKDNPSVLRAGSQCYDPLVSFNWAKLLTEWKERAPDVLDVATAIAVPENNCLSQSRKADVYRCQYSSKHKKWRTEYCPELVSTVLGLGGCSKMVVEIGNFKLR